jgi:hypothetical protein
MIFIIVIQYIDYMYLGIIDIMNIAGKFSKMPIISFTKYGYSMP